MSWRAQLLICLIIPQLVFAFSLPSISGLDGMAKSWVNSAYNFFAPSTDSQAKAQAEYKADDSLLQIMSGNSASVSNIAISSLVGLFGSQLVGYPGPSTLVISKIFYVLNIGLISIVGLLLSYTTTITVLNTAGEGTFMGQKMQGSYYATMIRIVGGAAALFPSIGGYSLLQSVLMAAIVQGSLFGDVVWSVIVKQTNAGVGLLSSSVSTDAKYIQQFLMSKSSGNYNKNVGTYNKMLSDSTNAFIGAYNIFVCGKIKDVKPTYSDGKSQTIFNVEGCGKLMASTDKESYIIPLVRIAQSIDSLSNGYASLKRNNAGYQSMRDARTLAMLGFATDFVGGVELFQLAAYASSRNTSNLIVNNRFGWMNAGAQYPEIEERASQATSSNFNLEAVNLNIKPSSNLITGAFGLQPEKSIKDEGIALASKKELTNLGDGGISSDATNLKKTMDGIVTKIISPDGLDDSTSVLEHEVDVSAAIPSFSQYPPLQNDYRYLIWNTVYSWQDKFINNPQLLLLSPIKQIKQFGLDMIEYGVIFFQAVTRDAFSLALTSGFTVLTTTSLVSVAGLVVQGAGIRVAATGQNIMYGCSDVPSMLGYLGCLFWPIPPLIINLLFIGPIVSLIGMIMTIVGTVAVAVVPSYLLTLFEISIANKMIYVTLASAMAAPLIALGGSIAFYVPFIPVLAYTVACISWLVAVIEVMVAVPMICLGVTYPQGHDLLGKAEQAAMLFVSIYLRPALIVIGFMFSVLTVGVMMILATVTIHSVLLDLFTDSLITNTSQETAAVFVLMSMIVYAIIVLNAVDYAFSFIFKLPSSVMRWIGLPTVDMMEEQYMQEIKSGAAGTASELSNAAGGMAQGLQDKAMSMQKKGGK